MLVFRIDSIFQNCLLVIAFVVALSVAPTFLRAQDHANRENLGDAINTKSVELLPLVAPDGQTLYFDRKNDSMNTGGADDDDDIYVSTLQADGKWSPPKSIGAPLNTKGSDVMCWISPDGNTALVHNGDLEARDSLGLGITRRENGVWSNPIPIRIQGLRTMGDGYYATISADGRRLMLSYAPDPNKESDFDIFFCPAYSTDLTQWGPPQRIGTDVNTTRYEGAPFVAADNRTLYFSSSRYGGLGSSDLYVTRRLDDTWLHWTPPVNLGITANSMAFDASMSITANGDFAYISAEAAYQEEWYGATDVYRVRLPDTLRPTRMATITGTVTGANQKGVRGLVRVESAVNGDEIASVASNESGSFMMLLPCDESYRMTATGVGYLESVSYFDARNNCSKTIGLQLKLRPEDTTKAWVPPNGTVVLFEFASDKLSADASALLKSVAKQLKAKKSPVVVDISGHTDVIGERQQNRDLSLRRAERVKQFLQKQGIGPSARMMVFGRGTRLPLTTNDSPDGRAHNRRVEIVIIDE